MPIEKTQRFSALYTRDFRLFWFGQIISLSGTWMHSVAQSWLVYSMTKSPLYLGLIASLSSLPILFFTLIGGSVADRYPKRKIIIITQSLSVIPAFTLGVLTYGEWVAIWQVGIIAFFFGTVNAFDVPARQAFLAEVVSKSDITNAIALNSAAFNGARIIGPLMAGFVIANFSMPLCFFLNALSFLPVVLALTMINASGTAHAGNKKFFDTIREGAQFVRREKSVFYIMSLIAIFSLFGIPYITLLPVLADAVFSEGIKGLSLLVSSAGVGSFVAAVIIAFKGEIKDKGFYIPFAALVFSVAILGIALSGSLHFALILIFFAGWGIVSFLAVCNSFIQQAVPDGLRGRIMSFYTLVFLGLAPIGNSAIGLAAHALGTLLSLRIFAAICILSSIVFFILFRNSCGERAL
ncbi:MAG TPA: MFS transporter [Dissulfurispiraceae bacterium]|nr:MFS transporter [Dissulfurispiraceae bacterium]